jgi:8-amino-7-oxononanoate synthase
VIGLCSNNYLGLADDPRLAGAAARALASHGTGAGAARHISGTSSLHRLLEDRLASFVKLPAALLFSSGYAANVGAVQALVGPGDAVFSDELNHASLIDGARLSRAQVFVYRHRDAQHLSDLLHHNRARHRAALILSETLFSMDGDEAPLPDLRTLARENEAGLLLDEAHALGVLGPQGRGLAAASGVVPDLLVATLGKALGTAGAFVAGAAETVALIQNRARSYVFSTAPMPASAAAAALAVDLVERADDRRRVLLAHARRLRAGLRELGYRLLDGDSAILPVLIGAAEPTMALSAALLEHGVFVHGIRPPTVATGASRLRVTPMATHTEAQITRALEVFAECRRYLL